MDLLSSHFNGAGRYYRLRDKSKHLTHRGIICDKDRLPAFEMINEKFIHYLWAEQIPKGLRYKTESGQPVEVIFPGYWNAQKGPDFTSAQIRIGDVLCKGDVEIHLYASEWYAHKHHLDDNYNNIILHVSFWADTKNKSIRCANHQVKPQVILSPLLMNRVGEIEKLVELAPDSLTSYRFGGVGKCYQACRKAGLAMTQEFLDIAGEARLADKLKLLSERSRRTSGNYDEILYQGLMQALGYKNNQMSFFALAEIITWKKITQLARRYSPAEYPFLMQAIFLQAGGFLSPVRHNDSTAQAQGYIADTRKILSRLLPPISAQPFNWSLSGVRPANYPQRRLAGISYLLSRYVSSDQSLLNELIGIFHGASSPEIITDKLSRIFYVPPVGYWSQHSNFTGKPFYRPVALIGKSRSNEITVNAVIPVMLLYAQELKDEKLAGAVIKFYRDLPAGSDNYATNFMKHRIFKEASGTPARIVNTALRQQGLLQIFNDFCKKGYDGCGNCGFISYLSGTF